MKFKQIDPHADMNVFCAVSETGVWELGIRQMLFGRRVSLTKIGDHWYTLDYCAADQPIFLLQLLGAIAIILDRYPEDIDPRKLVQEFPRFEIKPINKDPYCWDRLQEMASLDCNQAESMAVAVKAVLDMVEEKAIA